MKVKQVGSVPEEKPAEREIIKEHPKPVMPEFTEENTEEKKSNKKIFFILGGVLVVIVAALIYYFAFYQEDTKTQDSQQSENLKKRELELKERELQLKEKELQKNNTSVQTPAADITTPEGVVVKFIESLGRRDFSAAFALMTEKRRGSYSVFSSIKGYGGITSTKVFGCSKTGVSDGKTEVKAVYESIDPSNKSGKFEQYFYLVPLNNSYQISDIKNINIEWYEGK